MNIRSFKIVALAMALLASTFSVTVAKAAPLRIAVILPSAKNDMAFSQSMFTALKTIQKEMGGESALKIAYSENMYKVPDAGAAIREAMTSSLHTVLSTGHL